VDDLKGKKVIVCGGAGRMGLNIVTYLENQGAVPIIIDKIVKRKISDTFYQCDLSNFENTKLIFKRILEVHPDVRHMVNALRIRNVDEGTNDICKSSALINSGINSYIYPMHLFCDSDLSNGSVVNISSVLGNKISPNVPLAYHVTKAAIEQASKYYAANFKEHKIRINCIAPGLISNGASEVQSSAPDASYYAKIATKLPLQRSGSHNDVASLAAFLLSDASGFLTGTNIKLDGGSDLLELTSLFES